MMNVMPREVSPLIVKYGYRTLAILILLTVFSTFLLVEYFLSGDKNTFLLALSIIFYPLTIILFVAFRLTVVDRIHKKYFQNETLLNKSGKVLKGSSVGSKGSANISNEDWSFICDSTTKEGDTVEVIGILDDNITLKVRKID
jgi:membrane protein implicated in regulation of membrane protease activity